MEIWEPHSWASGLLGYHNSKGRRGAAWSGEKLRTPGLVSMASGVYQSPATPLTALSLSLAASSPASQPRCCVAYRIFLSCVTDLLL